MASIYSTLNNPLRRPVYDYWHKCPKCDTDCDVLDDDLLIEERSLFFTCENCGTRFWVTGHFVLDEVDILEDD